MGKFIRRDEQGATIVLVALALVALLAVTGLAIDGGRLYSDRRQVQNAADSAALAGTIALSKLVTGNEASIYNTVQTRVNENQATDTFTCQIIDEAQNVLQSCPTSNGTAVLPNAAGVKVLAKNTQNTSFMRATGINTFSASANAAATMQTLKEGSGPFLVCAVDKSDPRSGGNGLSGPDPEILLPDDSINPAAIGHEYIVHSTPGHGFYATCDFNNSSWKGIAEDRVFAMPGAWDTDPGDRSGPVGGRLAGVPECTGPSSHDLVIGCIMLLPLCHADPDPGSTLYCVRFGKFQLSYDGPGASHNTQKAIFLGGSVVATTGQGGGLPGADDARVIKLVQ